MDLRFSDDSKEFFLPEECVIENAVELKSALMEVLKKKKTERVNVSEVKRLDLSGIQLLYALLQSGNTDGRQLGWTGDCAEVTGNAFDISGYAELMKRHRVEPGDRHDR